MQVMHCAALSYIYFRISAFLNCLERKWIVLAENLPDIYFDCGILVNCYGDPNKLNKTTNKDRKTSRIQY